MGGVDASPNRPGPHSEAGLRRKASADWWDLVQGWAGAVMRLGEPVVEAREVEMELGSGSGWVKRQDRKTARARVPCDDQGPPACLQLETVIEPELASVNRSMASMTARLQRALGGTANDFGSSKVTNLQLPSTMSVQNRIRRCSPSVAWPWSGRPNSHGRYRRRSTP